MLLEDLLCIVKKKNDDLMIKENVEDYRNVGHIQMTTSQQNEKCLYFLKPNISFLCEICTLIL